MPAAPFSCRRTWHESRAARAPSLRCPRIRRREATHRLRRGFRALPTAALPVLGVALLWIGLARAAGWPLDEVPRRAYMLTKLAVRGYERDPRQTVLERKVRGLGDLAARLANHQLLPSDRATILVSEAVVQELLASALPYETLVDEQFRVRLDSAQVSFGDGLALVRLEGRASLASAAETRAAADLTLYASLEVEALSRAGLLDARLEMLGFEVRGLELLGVRTPLAGLADALARGRLEDVGAPVARIRIPVRLHHELQLPELSMGDVAHIRSQALSVRIAPSGAEAFAGKLWVPLRVGLARP